MEHLHSDKAPGVIQEAIADSMPIVRDLIVKELHEEPSVLLGREAWNVLLDQARVFRAEQDACRASFDGIGWESETLGDAFKDFRCSRCSSTLIRNDSAKATKPADLVLVCSKCGEALEVDEVIEAALQESLAWDMHVAVKDGDDPPLEECPECCKETYATYEGKCLNPECGFSLEGYECAVCSESLTLDDYRYGDGRLCSYHAHVMSKDD